MNYGREIISLSFSNMNFNLHCVPANIPSIVNSEKLSKIGFSNEPVLYFLLAVSMNFPYLKHKKYFTLFCFAEL